MADFVQRLSALWLLCGCGLPAAAQKPFSHALHLGLKLACVTCHVKAPSSTKASDNLMPSPALCRQCHDRDMPVREPRSLFVSKFNHQAHVRMGNVATVVATAIDQGKYLSPVPAGYRGRLDTKTACAGCHHGIEQSETVDGSNFPRMADCLVCHSEIDAPFSCEKCHDPPARLKPPSHAADFIDRHSNRKFAASLDKSTCPVCHGRTFTCLGCH